MEREKNITLLARLEGLKNSHKKCTYKKRTKTLFVCVYETHTQKQVYNMHRKMREREKAIKWFMSR